MGRFARSWDLTKTSYRVLMQDKELLWMPVLSGIATILTMVMVTGIAYGLGLAPEVTTADGQVKPLAIVLTLATYILLAFVTLFFGSAVVAGASERLAGGDPTVSSALKAAWSKAGKIFVWAVIVGVVNLLLQMLREIANRSGDMGRIFGNILISLGAAAWNLATWFMIPILLFENHGVGGSVKSSVRLVKQHWGEAVISNVGLGLAGFLFTLVAVVIGVGLMFLLQPVLGIVGIVIGAVVLVVGVLAVSTVFSALGGVYKAALYRFATTSATPPGFTTEQLSQAYVRQQ